MTALAEGVETEGQLKALVELGCVHAQGYLFGKPRPISEVWQSQAFPPVAAGKRMRGAARRLAGPEASGQLGRTVGSVVCGASSDRVGGGRV